MRSLCDGNAAAGGGGPDVEQITQLIFGALDSARWRTCCSRARGPRRRGGPWRRRPPSRWMAAPRQAAQTPLLYAQHLLSWAEGEAVGSVFFFILRADDFGCAGPSAVRDVGAPSRSPQPDLYLRCYWGDRRHWRVPRRCLGVRRRRGGGGPGRGLPRGLGAATAGGSGAGGLGGGLEGPRPLPGRRLSCPRRPRQGPPRPGPARLFFFSLPATFPKGSLLAEVWIQRPPRVGAPPARTGTAFTPVAPGGGSSRRCGGT